MRFAPGTPLGPYVIAGPLGAGGMGEVYRAGDRRLGRDVAIKVLSQEFTADPDRVRRFEQEARAVAALNHPHICQIYDVGRLTTESTLERGPIYLAHHDASCELRRVLELDENLWFTHFILRLEQLRAGWLADAVDHAERASALAPWSPSAKGLLAAASKMDGQLQRAEELLDRLKSGLPYGTPLALATFHLACSEIDASAEWIERAIGERHPAVFFFLRAHGHALCRSARWPRLASLLKLPVAP